MTKRICTPAVSQFQQKWKPYTRLPASHWQLLPLHTVLQTYVLGSAEGDASDALDAGQVQLLHGLASLLLVARVNDGGRASGQAGVARLDFGIGAVIVLLFLDGDVLGLLVGQLFDSGVGHFCVARECVCLFAKTKKGWSVIKAVWSSLCDELLAAKLLPQNSSQNPTILGAVGSVFSWGACKRRRGRIAPKLVEK